MGAIIFKGLKVERITKTITYYNFTSEKEQTILMSLFIANYFIIKSTLAFRISVNPILDK